MLFFPERVALLGVAIYLALWVAAPLNLVFPLSVGATAYVLACYAAFGTGCLLVAGRRLRIAPFQSRGTYLLRGFWTAAALGACGMWLRVYDKFFLRGVNFEDSALEARAVLAEVGAGPIAALGGFLYPFCFVPLILWWGRPPDTRLHPAAKWIAVTLFALPALDALTLLSRSLMLATFSMMYFAAACVLYKGQLLHRNLVKPALGGLVLLLAVSVFAFSSRLGQMDMDTSFSILHSLYGHVLTPTAEAMDAMASKSSLVAGVFSALIPILQYYLHGFLEFGLLWERPDAQVFTYGAQHFAPYVKALAIFGVIDYPDFGTEDVYFRTGVFTTFFGPLWVDFGWWGVTFMFAFGALCKLCARLARTGDLAVMPLYAYFCVALVFMPVVNFIDSAQGMYIINALLLVWAFLPRRPAQALSALHPIEAQGPN